MQLVDGAAMGRVGVSFLLSVGSDRINPAVRGLNY